MLRFAFAMRFSDFFQGIYSAHNHSDFTFINQPRCCIQAILTARTSNKCPFSILSFKCSKNVRTERIIKLSTHKDPTIL